MSFNLTNPAFFFSLMPKHILRNFFRFVRDKKFTAMTQKSQKLNNQV